MQDSTINLDALEAFPSSNGTAANAAHDDIFVNASEYQKAIYDFVLNGRGDGVINAVAGSGKTTTIVNASKLPPAGTRVLFAAFNKSIVEELRERLPESVTCKTINAIGHAALMHFLGGNVKLEDSKYRDLIKAATANAFALSSADGEYQRLAFSALQQLVSFAQSTMCGGTGSPSDADLDDMALRYGIEIPVSNQFTAEWFFDVVRSVLREGAQMAHEQHVISFNDQVWLPNVWNLKPRVYDFVFVDECQDLSRVKLELILKCRAAGGRIIAVGDPRQSIYGFSGADPRAWEEIIERTQAQVFPLSVCYRCPTKVLEYAQKIVPEIEAAPNAPEGIVRQIKYTEMLEEVVSGDLVLCRLTAPLVSACIELIRRRTPARVIGRDIASQLIGLAKDVLRHGSWATFGESLEAYVADQTQKFLLQKNGESKAQSLQDRAAGLMACYEAYGADSFANFCSEIEGLFTDGNAAIELSTIHKAKGRQRRRVCILASRFRLRPEALDWQHEQESNLRYVALTRAQSEMIFVAAKEDR